ncbi:plasmid mobilization protein [Segetibacter koreensis]|uniref:plasmid mobilization protein n=1 Tax=Segetibacter koreensis TaxID=398037 RepID=UPI0003656BC4|nr:plasmid mobilization relaxosome protein MobC [Segetibacter koreensis]
MEKVRSPKKKAGRPAKMIKREIRACVRFTKTEYFIIRQKASKAGIKPSAYIRQIAINEVVMTRLSEEERQFVRQLVGMSNNLNQLAKNSHKEGMLKTMVYFENYRSQLDVLLQKLNHG